MSKFKKLKDLCIKITDGSHYSPEGQNTGIPMLSVKDMRNNGFDYSNCKYISYEEYNKMIANDCHPLINDVLIAKDGSYLKNVFVIIEDKKQAILSSIGIIRPNTEIINPYYIKYYLTSDFVKKEVSKKYVSGSALPRIILKGFSDIDIPYLDLNKQNEIVKVLKAFDDKIENNNKIIAELESMAKTLYDYWFLQFEFPNEEGKPYKSSGGKMVYNEELKREIPEGWSVENVAKRFDIIGGYPFSSNNYCKQSKNKLYTIKNVQDGFIISKVDTYIKNVPSNMESECYLKPKDLIMSLTGNVARVGLVYENDCLLNQRVLKIKNKENNFGFGYCLFRNESIKTYLERMSSGTSQKNLSPNEVGKMLICMPSKKVLDLFGEKVNPMINKIVKCYQENQELASLRDFLLPMLMNGQITFK